MFDINSFFQACYIVGCGIMGLWGFLRVIKELKGNNDAEVKRRQRWDNAATVIEENKEKWDKGLSDIYSERQTIVRRFDERLDEVDNKIDLNHRESEKEIREMKEEIMILTKSVKALLEGKLEQIQDAKDGLDNFMLGKM